MLARASMADLKPDRVRAAGGPENFFSGPPKSAKRSAKLAIRTCRGKPRYVRHGQASAQCSRGCLMRLARAAVAEASRAPPAGADAASTALRDAARTVGFVGATLNSFDPGSPPLLVLSGAKTLVTTMTHLD